MDRVLVWIGLSMVAIGLLIAGVGWLFARGGRFLPGDIVISRPGFTFIFPLVTSIIISMILTLIFWVFAAWRR